MNRRRILTLAASSAAAVTVFPARARAQTALVRVAASTAATQAGAYYTEQLGYFKTAGVSATVVPAARGSETLAAVARGDIDIASATPAVIANAIIHNIPLKIIAHGSIYADPPSIGLYVAKDAAIKKPADLSGLVIGVNSLNDAQTLAIWQWMAQAGVDPASVKVLEIPFSSMAAALKRKEIAGACLVEPFATAGKDDIRVVPGVYASLGRRWAFSSYYARTDYIEKNPTLVRNVINAFYNAAKRVNANPNDIEQLAATYTKMPLETIHAIVKPIFAERTERSNLEPQMIASAKFKIISRPIGYDEMMAVV